MEGSRDLKAHVDEGLTSKGKRGLNRTQRTLGNEEC